ncbi:hypothetical protein AGABI1DRAFT_111111 [Agaricus bisporus var. burnettii JB137-S8]|uniref:Uncharacterized protein n=1 Tax=Agaricus bisporus var. burnettii (strain JB137-S8 / ATCC MYA-4627 / FGSC 10392) TaxID=597362 RepID=K5X8L4_AGABU|nr:uncharacterized protein AGABI1DRAFT_111111 [Agaricus bisporus var. burnettii JB137-S8]XP_007330182.1 uncharacterized protein AGABI1DRAFT_114087 [Agaricus bisporus var. burnettii JB137-S8]XP_007335941.1 uncharacterized protein AGABI1DRAFT_116854 [Agaricus bisporus var. burnettii JB137-S8]EKM73420.1 hypothetical protein AGABI1DRAFT_116854 [Agaricus bisporus var. burnettii JB137-S8]EKM79553.1 hypothetical protein AGABI1DRAFT_114087 [Agaricus bisporus var. burnettii JB137-S8]EKM82499.1 hypothet
MSLPLYYTAYLCYIQDHERFLLFSTIFTTFKIKYCPVIPCKPENWITLKPGEKGIQPTLNRSHRSNGSVNKGKGKTTHRRSWCPYTGAM